MKIGIVPMSAKPFHTGHNALIKFAAGIELLDSLAQQGFIQQENDVVNVYVSYSSRDVKKRTRTIRKGVKEKYEEPIPGKAPVFGADMEYIWENILTEENLGYDDEVVRIISPKKSGKNSPIRAAFALANAFKEAYNSNEELWRDDITGSVYNVSDTILTFYCGIDDEEKYRRETSYYYPVLVENGVLNVVAIPRVVSISGTQMREYLCSGNLDALKVMLPFELSEEHKTEIATILSKSVSCGYPSSRLQAANESLVKEYIGLFLL